MKANLMARAQHKNKKPETNNKNRTRNYFLGSFGSPCSFWRLAPKDSRYTDPRSFLHHPLTKC
ncbi:hypothetical protein SAMN04487857_10726 [Pseudomonas sp. ok272]|nr:hypothetical protein SAMN04487857_10726 [Pseudomonas sp. ok272]SFM96174.1 hypothetical protein SAMN04487858_109190 [Pseudomonas sp. ok602]